jgi:hypothetical protein
MTAGYNEMGAARERTEIQRCTAVLNRGCGTVVATGWGVRVDKLENYFKRPE